MHSGPSMVYPHIHLHADLRRMPTLTERWTEYVWLAGAYHMSTSLAHDRELFRISSRSVSYGSTHADNACAATANTMGSPQLSISQLRVTCGAAIYRCRGSHPRAYHAYALAAILVQHKLSFTRSRVHAFIFNPALRPVASVLPNSSNCSQAGASSGNTRALTLQLARWCLRPSASRTVHPVGC